MSKHFITVGVFTLIAACAFVPSAIAELTIGNSAPKLDVEHWVRDGGGKFKPVTEFEEGKVYVVEFWATWCGPCIASMPHIADLQKTYADKGVQVVSISDEDLETVTEFLERPVRGAQEDADGKTQTYGELTDAYCLTTDPDQSSYEDYMVAASQNGIPTAFVVGKDAKIEWIGHPMELDDVLSAVVGDTWDREKFAAEFKAEQEAQKAMQEIYALLSGEKFEEALEKLDSLPKVEGMAGMQTRMLKLQVLLAAKKIEGATAHLDDLYKDLADNAQAVNMVAWNLYEMSQQGELESKEILAKSTSAVEKAVEKSSNDAEKSSILDTLAHLYHQQGELDKALATQEKAVSLAGEGDKKFIQDFLDQLRSEKESGEKPE